MKTNHRFASLGLVTLAWLSSLVAAPPSAKDITVTPDVQAVANSNNAFACDLFSQLGASGGNLFYSPTSISTALAMCYAGAGGDTAEQMAKALHFSLPGVRLHPAFARFTTILNDAGTPPAYQISVANALWTQLGFPLQPGFLEIMKRDYGAEEHAVDFKQDVEAARQTINKWVASQTRDRIKDLLAQGSVQPDVRLVLTNAIYFKGDWLSPFKKEGTYAQDFHITAEKTAKANMMHQTEFAQYAEDGDKKLLELPYKGGTLTMVFVLPTKKFDLPSIERQLSARAVADWIGLLKPEQVRVAIPKVKMNTGFELSKVLSAMGMAKAFTMQADFRPMANVPGEPLYIGQVIHKAFLAVDELGTEAAAATAVTMRAGSAAPRQLKEFTADQPFLFFIRDRRTGAILFLGRCTEPGQ